MDLKDQSFRDSIGTGKIIMDKHEPLNHFPKTLEFDFLKDHYFSVKKQTSSSMEISLEPAGLGKLDIELKLTQDRLQGQIMVNDKAGKELIERSLPQLLSDLAREGLQIGGFTVSLRNQGRGQLPFPIRNDYKEPSLETVSSGTDCFDSGESSHPHYYLKEDFMAVSAVPSNTLDKNAFLKLFTVQLKNQDPLNPMDATAFTAQMAQFSSLEQLYNVNTNLNNLVSSQNSLLQGMSVNLIGKTVTLQDGSSGQVTGISFEGTTPVWCSITRKRFY